MPLSQSFISVPERLSSIKLRIKRFVSSTQEHFCSRFLYYFCLCKSFKELFPIVLVRRCSWFAGAKVRLFSEPPKLFHKKITFFHAFFMRSWFMSIHRTTFTLLYYIRKADFAKSQEQRIERMKRIFYHRLRRDTVFFKKTTDWTDETDFSTTDCTDDTGYNRINMQEILSNKNKF